MLMSNATNSPRRYCFDATVCIDSDINGCIDGDISGDISGHLNSHIANRIANYNGIHHPSAPQAQLLGEYDSAGQAIREYVWLGSTPVAMFTPDPAAAANPPLTYYIHTDHLNTPRVVVNTIGAALRLQAR
jgi:hypothetical protein